MSRRPIDGLLFSATLFSAIAIAGTISLLQNSKPSLDERKADYVETVTAKRLSSACKLADVAPEDCNEVLTGDARTNRADENL